MAKDRRQMKSLSVPYIEGLETLDYPELSAVLRSRGARAPIDSLNWPERFPYAPEATAFSAYTADSLVISYEVIGYDLRALETADNQHPWENSCCEFFVACGAGEYMNFELACNGSLLVARGSGRDGRTQLGLDALSRIKRFGSLELGRVYDIVDEIREWGIAIVIPFDIICGKPGVPDSLDVNFYKCANKSAHPHFLSWNQIKTPAPDFHRPEFFARMLFEKKS